MNRLVFGASICAVATAAMAAAPTTVAFYTTQADTLVVPPDIHAQSLTSDSVTFMHYGVRETRWTFRIGPGVVLVPGAPAPKAVALVLDGAIVGPIGECTDTERYLEGRTVEFVETLKKGKPGPGSIDHAFLILRTRPAAAADSARIRWCRTD